MKRRISNEEREFSLMELLWYVLEKWKWLLAGIVAGALLLGGFGAYKNYNANRNNEAQSSDDILKDLPESRQELILSAVELNNTYKEMNENINTNYLMRLNPDNLVKATLQYYVDTDYKINLTEDIENDYIVEIIDMYVLMVDGNDVCKDVMELGISNLKVNDIDYIVATSVNEGVFKVMVSANEGDCEKITRVIKTHIEQYHDTVADSIGEHKTVLVSENYSHTYSDYIRNAQTTRRNLLKTYSDSLTSAKKSFTQAELDVFNQIIEERDSDDSTNDKSGNLINTKFIILGILCGVFLVIFISVMVYMFGRRIRSLGEIEQVYHVDLIGKIAVRQNVFTAKRNKMPVIKDVSEQVEYVVKTIEAGCRLKGIQSVMLCTSVKSDSNETDAVIKGLVKTGINVSYGDSINTDTTTLNMVIDIGNCIFIEQLDVSDRKAVAEEIEICDRLNIDIMGMIVII